MNRYTLTSRLPVSRLRGPVEYVRYGSGAKVLEISEKVVAPFPNRSAVIDALIMSGRHS